MFLLCLGLPPILVFSVTPLWGGRGFAHWTMPGWFFAFALMGAWLDESGFLDGALRRCAFVSSALLAALAAVTILQSSTGWPLVTLTAGAGLPDPTLDGFEWRDLSKVPIFDKPPSFVVSTKWSDAGKIAIALGPKVPVFVFSKDPRGWAFLDESDKFIGRDGVIVARTTDLDLTLVAAKPYFTALGRPHLPPSANSAAPKFSLRLSRPVA